MKIVAILVAATILFFMPVTVAGTAQDEAGPVLELPDALILRYAQVAKGEDGRDPAMPACVMRNRILRGWNPDKVLNHFYAPARRVSDSELAAVKAAVLYGAGCDERAYFQFSDSDLRRVQVCPGAFLFRVNGNSYFSIDALKGC